MNDRYNTSFAKSVIIFDLDLHFKVKLSQIPKNIVKSLKIFLSTTVSARGEQKPVS
jgi:hypothetical protein